MLDSFIQSRQDGGVFITSYHSAGVSFSNLVHVLMNTLYKRNKVLNGILRGYKGNTWIGRSHKSEEGGSAWHPFRWIKKECRKRGLLVKELKEDVISRQVWLKIW